MYLKIKLLPKDIKSMQKPYIRLRILLNHQRSPPISPFLSLHFAKSLKQLLIRSQNLRIPLEMLEFGQRNTHILPNRVDNQLILISDNLTRLLRRERAVPEFVGDQVVSGGTKMTCEYQEFRVIVDDAEEDGAALFQVGGDEVVALRGIVPVAPAIGADMSRTPA
jgi:hypothetical protein